MKFPDEADQLRMPRERGASISHPSQKQRRTESSHQTVCFYKRTQGESLCKKKCTGCFAERRNGPRGPSLQAEVTHRQSLGVLDEN